MRRSRRQLNRNPKSTARLLSPLWRVASQGARKNAAHMVRPLARTPGPVVSRAGTCSRTASSSASPSEVSNRGWVRTSRSATTLAATASATFRTTRRKNPNATSGSPQVPTRSMAGGSAGGSGPASPGPLPGGRSRTPQVHPAGRPHDVGGRPRQARPRAARRGQARWPSFEDARLAAADGAPHPLVVGAGLDLTGDLLRATALHEPSSEQADREEPAGAAAPGTRGPPECGWSPSAQGVCSIRVLVCCLSF